MPVFNKLKVLSFSLENIHGHEPCVGNVSGSKDKRLAGTIAIAAFGDESAYC
jgi:hypothetical protein